MLTVACVLWQGDFRGRRYSPEWVRLLKSMVGRNLHVEHRFVCLSNVDVDGVETIPLTEDLPGWWSKVELFKHDFGDRTIYFDLDVVITGDITPLADYPEPMAFMPPYYTIVGSKPAGGKGVVDEYQTSVMMCDAGEGREIYDRFDKSVMDLYRGDQDWIGVVLPGKPLFPGKWFRKLKDCKEGPDEETKVVLSMPWKNDEASLKFPWVADIWQ